MAARESLSASLSLLLRLIGRDPDPTRSLGHVVLSVFAERRLRADEPAPISGMRVEEAVNRIRIDVETAAPKRLARFVVGLGEAAKPLTAEFQAEVTDLARGALAASR